MTRFNIIDSNQLQPPHKCGICGAYTGKFITFDFWVEFYGNVYFCLNCLRAAAQQIEMVPAIVYSEAMNQVTEYKAVVSNILDENRNLRSAVDNLRAISRSEPSSLVVYVEKEPAEPAKPVEAQPEPNVTEPGPTESANVRRSEVVRDDDPFSFSSIGLSI